ncbi:MAG: ABC transporter ATP-binding protein [Ruminococcaceae bacterium]|nr:ABC transporter ATP-binding protein [Oscillospiraceae bacterium]
MAKLLEIKNLHSYFETERGLIKAVSGVSLTIEEGKTLGVVGESGSGKSQTALAILKLFESNQRIYEGEILLEGTDISKYSQNEMYHVRGNTISMIFQEPMTSLNPVFQVHKQISEVLILHQGMTKKQAYERSVEMLEEVKIPNPEEIAKQYPHQLSGGMRQRVMIAMALACKPKLLIADEPTTALDVTIQAQILRLMNSLQETTSTAIMFITHDLGVINQMADDVAVMYCGEVVESAPVDAIFKDITDYSHPYTEALLLSIPLLSDSKTKRLEAIPGSVPHPLALPKGCKFAPRCKYATERCLKEEPELKDVGNGQAVRCFYPKKGVRNLGE